VAIRPDRDYYIPAVLVASKLYSNSLLAILNARIRMSDTTTTTRANVSGAPAWRTNISVTGNIVVSPVTASIPHSLRPGSASRNEMGVL
jgi:hypothetical protein